MHSAIRQTAHGAAWRRNGERPISSYEQENSRTDSSAIFKFPSLWFVFCS